MAAALDYGDLHVEETSEPVDERLRLRSFGVQYPIMHGLTTGRPDLSHSMPLASMRNGMTRLSVSPSTRSFRGEVEGIYLTSRPRSAAATMASSRFRVTASERRMGSATSPNGCGTKADSRITTAEIRVL